MRKSSHHLRTVLVLLLISLAAAGAAEFSRAFSRYPADGNPRTLIAGRDGYLYGVLAEFTQGRGSGGGIFRVAPDDDFRMLHRFDITRSSFEPNGGGATPTELVVMGRDGCLHGLAQNGGLFGYGVLYRIRPDGEFAVICHLDPSQLPPGTSFSAAACTGLLEGPDDAFYTCLLYGSGPNVLRIGRDGKMSFVGRVDNVTRAFTDPYWPSELICVSTRVLQPGAGFVFADQVKITRFAVSGSQQGAVQIITSPVFDSSLDSLWPVAWTPRGVVVRATWRGRPGYSDQLCLVNLQGEIEVLADFGWNGEGELPPEMNQFVHLADDGTIYYATDEDMENTGGSTLLARAADGTLRVLCGFPDGRMIQAFHAGAQDLCGASFSSKVLLPLAADAAYSPDWLADETRHQVVNHAKRGGLFFQVSLTDSPDVDSRPIAEQDIVKAKPKNDLFIRNLRNDWDPEGNDLRMNHVTPPERGHFQKSSLQCLYRSLDGGRSGGYVSYEVLDTTPRVSVGSILILGNPTGTYRDAERIVGRKPFAIGVKRDGTFTAGVPRSNGTPVVMTGKIDWHNRGLAQVLLPSGESIAFSVRLVTDGDSEAALDYLIRSSVSGESIGSAVLAP